MLVWSRLSPLCRRGGLLCPSLFQIWRIWRGPQQGAVLAEGVATVGSKAGCAAAVRSLQRSAAGPAANLRSAFRRPPDASPVAWPCLTYCLSRIRPSFVCIGTSGCQRCPRHWCSSCTGALVPSTARPTSLGSTFESTTALSEPLFDGSRLPDREPSLHLRSLVTRHCAGKVVFALCSETAAAKSLSKRCQNFLHCQGGRRHPPQARLYRLSCACEACTCRVQYRSAW